MVTDSSSSFLPQDKVSAFAMMEPPVVLRETMRAAGDHRLSKWHEKLVELGAKALEVEAVCMSTLSTLTC